MKDWLQRANERRRDQAAILHATPEWRERRKLFWVWADMIGRCTNPKHKAFENYGARGIKVSPSWASSFDRFLADMGPRAAMAMLERVDNNLGYGPDNCRWATRKEQNSNRRNCIYVELAGDRVTLKEACRRLNLKYRLTHKRISERGWTLAEALSGKRGIQC